MSDVAPQLDHSSHPQTARRAVRQAALLVLWLGAGPAFSQSLDEQFVSGLRQRRLYDLAEQYCRRELASSELDEPRRAALEIELIRTYAEHALHVSPAERERYWQAAHDVAQQRRPSGEVSREVLVRVQDALTWLAQGELARMEAELRASATDAQEQAFETARQPLRRAIAALSQLAQDVNQSLVRLDQTRGAANAAFSERELIALLRNVEFQLARGLRNQALCYPEDSPDRANSLTRAVELLAPMAELSQADDTVWRARLELVGCYRLLGSTQQAQAALAKLVSGGPQAPILLRAMSEKIQLQLAAGDLSEAMRSVDQGRTAGGVASAELDDTHMQVIVAELRAAAKSEDAARVAALQQRATAQVQRIEREHGPYWMRRAETLLASAVASSSSGVPGGSTAALRRAAESYYRGGRINEALETYDLAFQAAMEAGEDDAAFSAGFTAATIERSREKYDDALARYRRLAQTLPKHSRANEAHLLAIVCAVDSARAAEDAVRADRMQQYEDLLHEHLERWPRGEPASQVYAWLGKLHESRREWSQAIAAYRQTAPADEPFEAAVRAAARCYEAQLTALDAAKQDAATLVAEGAAFFEKIILGSDRRWPERWTALQRDCALFTARLKLRADDGAQRAEHVLRAALKASPEAQAAWQAEARLLLVIALATQARAAEANAEMAQISAGSAESLNAALARLSQLAEAARPEVKPTLADLELRIAGLLESRREELDDAGLRRLETARAAALVRAGRLHEALVAYRALQKQYPRDGDVHEAHAALLARATDAASLRAALAAWQDVERKTRRGEARWFRARLAQAELLHRLQDDPAAIKLLKLTALLQPELGGVELKPRFEALLRAYEK